MIIVSERPTNGVDLSHWNPGFDFAVAPSWLKFFGHKATHPGGRGMEDGVDPKFDSRRLFATRQDIEYRAFYSWIVPTALVRPAAQVELLARTVGELLPGESVYLDWEEAEVSLAQIEEMTVYMNLEFGNRWFMYVNDATADMKTWLEANKKSDLIPVMHPAYDLDKGLKEALNWKAMVWQTGKGTPSGFGADVPLDYILRPDVLNRVCGRS